MNPKKVGMLLYKHVRHELDPSEAEELAAWRMLSTENEQLFRDKTNSDKVRAEMTALYERRDRIFQRIKDQFPDLADAKLSTKDFDERPAGVRWIIPRFARVAALILVVLGVTTFIIYTTLQNKIQGSKNMAMIITPNGVTMELSDFQRGKLAAMAGISFKEAANGQLVFVAADHPDAKRDDVFKLYTNLDQHCRMELSDGTQIWMNELTAIKYPANLSQDSLRIDLSGDSYFESSKGKWLIINAEQSTSNGQGPTQSNIQITANGAAFEVKTYPDESLSVTLVKGFASIRWNTGHADSTSVIQLLPGQQIKIQGGKPTLTQNGDLQKITGWRNW